jgi:lycopene cyclase domain-containing protein
LFSLADRPLAGCDRDAYIGLVVLITLAVVYTTPWDNHMIEQGVWWYGENHVLFRINYAPIEEYLFFVLQPILTGLWLYSLPRNDTERAKRELSNFDQLSSCRCSRRTRH